MKQNHLKTTGLYDNKCVMLDQYYCISIELAYSMWQVQNPYHCSAIMQCNLLLEMCCFYLQSFYLFIVTLTCINGIERARVYSTKNMLYPYLHLVIFHSSRQCFAVTEYLAASLIETQATAATARTRLLCDGMFSNYTSSCSKLDCCLEWNSYE